jgi:hypothetical protein
MNKIAVHIAYITLLHNKIKVLNNELAALLSDAENETKSSAGDKHETAISLLQLQQEKISFQLNDAHIQLQALQKINPETIANTVAVGSLVLTNKGYLYISLALGKITIDDAPIMAVSPQSPIGIALKGHSTNSKVMCNGMEFIILSTE